MPSEDKKKKRRVEFTSTYWLQDYFRGVRLTPLTKTLLITINGLIIFAGIHDRDLDWWSISAIWLVYLAAIILWLKTMPRQ